MIEILGHIANFLYTFGSSFKNQLYLRLSFIIAAILEIIFAFLFIKGEPIWTIIIWSFPMMLINGYYFYRILQERKELYLTPEEEKIFYKSFSYIDKRYFKKILNLGKKINLKKDDLIIEEQVETEYFYLIYEGIAEVKLNGNLITYISDGIFIGEMSFLTSSKPKASVFAKTDMVLYRWNKDEMQIEKNKDRDFDNAVNAVLSNDLVAKIDRINSGG